MDTTSICSQDKVSGAAAELSEHFSGFFPDIQQLSEKFIPPTKHPGTGLGTVAVF